MVRFHAGCNRCICAVSHFGGNILRAAVSAPAVPICFKSLFPATRSTWWIKLWNCVTDLVSRGLVSNLNLVVRQLWIADINSKDQQTITSFTRQTANKSKGNCRKQLIHHSELGNVLFSHLPHFLCLLRPLSLLWSSHWEVETVPGLRSLSGRIWKLFNWQAIRDCPGGGHFSDGTTTSCKIVSSDFDARRTWRNWTINKQRILSTTKLSPGMWVQINKIILKQILKTTLKTSQQDLRSWS